MTASRSIRRDIAWGVRRGFAYAIVYCVVLLAILLARGRDSLEQRGFSPVTALLIYLTVGPLAGGLVGLLKPLAQRRIGAALLGAIVALPCMTCVAMFQDGYPTSWDRDTFGAILLISLTAGPAFGWASWRGAD